MDPSRVPAAGVRVRCPSCGHVFRVRMRPPQAVQPVAVQPQVPTSALPGDDAEPLAAPATSTPTASAASPVAPVAAPRALPADPDSVLPGIQRENNSLFGPAKVTAPVAPEVPAAPAPPQSKPAQPAPWSQGERTIDFAAPSAPPKASPTLETPPFRPGAAAPAAPMPPQQTVVQQPATPVVPSAPVASEESGVSGEHKRARRLARVLVSDIMVYNQQSRDKALAAGNLVSALGGEVNKAWELYKSKVASQILEDSDYFKDALNEILADGRKVF